MMAMLDMESLYDDFIDAKDLIDKTTGPWKQACEF